MEKTMNRIQTLESLIDDAPKLLKFTQACYQKKLIDAEFTDVITKKIYHF